MLPLNAVVQGPLVSHPSPSRKWPDGIDADCSSSVIQTARSIREIGGTTTISTWSHQPREVVEKCASARSIVNWIETEDPGRPPDTNGPVSGNQFRQNLSTWMGIESLIQSGATGLVVKVRSDQVLPLKRIHAFVNRKLSQLDSESRDRAIFIAAAHSRSLFEIDDFYFVGTTKAMQRFFEAQIRLAAYFSGTTSIHGDLVRKHFAWTVGPAQQWPAWRCFPTIPPRLPQSIWPRIDRTCLEQWVTTLRRYLIPMPREIWNETTWRGSPPFSEWYSAGEDRIWFEDLEDIEREREDFFLRRWPHLFNRGSGVVSLKLDYAAEIPMEIERGHATWQSKSRRRIRRLFNRVRYHQIYK